MTKWITGITLICILALAMSGCLFDTRDAEPPADEGDDVIPLDDPLGVFQAMTVALESRKDANYERAISERFVFSPTRRTRSTRRSRGPASTTTGTRPSRWTCWGS
jgi:hypothetical protein